MSLGQYIDLVRQGTIKVLGIAGPKRVSYLPDIGTFAEQGFPGFEVGTWFALFAPQSTPQEIVDKLNGYVRGLHDDPDSRKRLDAAFLEPMPQTAAQFGEQVKRDAAKWERIVRDSGMKQD